MKLARNRQSGHTFILVLILLALGSLLVVPMLRQSITSQKYHQLIESNTLEAYAADSGVQYALCEVYNDPVAIQESPLQESRVINNRTVDITVEYVTDMSAYKITSTATSSDGRSTTIESFVIIDIGLFGNTFAVDGDLRIEWTDITSDPPGEASIYTNGNLKLSRTTVDGDVTATGTVMLETWSEVHGDVTADSTVTLDWSDLVSDPPREANIYTNGNVWLDQANVDNDITTTGAVNLDWSDVYGDVTANGGISKDMFSHIYGEEHEEGAEPITVRTIEFPEINTEGHAQKAMKGGIRGDLTYRFDGTQHLGPLYIDGDLRSEFTDIILEGTVYVTGNVYLEHGTLYGWGDIIAEGGITFNFANYDADSLETLPLVMSVNGDIGFDFAGTTIVEAVLYAPTGTVDLHFVDLYGSVAADLVVVEWSDIHYPAELRGRADLPGAGLKAVSYSYK